MNIRVDVDELGIAEDKSVTPEWQVRFIEIRAQMEGVILD